MRPHSGASMTAGSCSKTNRTSRVWRTATPRAWGITTASQARPHGELEVAGPDGARSGGGGHWVRPMHLECARTSHDIGLESSGETVTARPSG